ncbi:MAG: hypothetical protein K0R57_1328 [Paenibacillaceae bacterium]|jgi:AraC-like DNA-binding protein|nr:hypothetical protein [Paenibacillaceae bacterium]
MLFGLAAPFFWDELVVRPRWAREMTMEPHVTFSEGNHYMRNPYLVGWLVLEGERTVEVDGTHRQINAGELVFFHPNTRYRLLAENSRIHYLSIGCELTAGAMEISSLYKFPSAVMLTAEEKARLRRTWQELISRFDDMKEQLCGTVSPIRGGPRTPQDIPEAAWLAPAVSMAYFGFQSAIFCWLQAVMEVVKPGAPEMNASVDHRVKEVCSLIHRKFHDPLTLAALAEHVFVSPSHLSYLFIRSMNCAPMEYLRRVRLQQAKRLLADSRLTVKEVAERTGFESQGNFARAFRKAEQISPLAYRKQWLLH